MLGAASLVAPAMPALAVGKAKPANVAKPAPQRPPPTTLDLRLDQGVLGPEVEALPPVVPLPRDPPTRRPRAFDPEAVKPGLSASIVRAIGRADDEANGADPDTEASGLADLLDALELRELMIRLTTVF